MVLCGLYFIYFLISIIERPYFSKLSNGLTSSCYILNSATSALGIALSGGVNIPQYAFIIMGVINIVFPVAFLVTEFVESVRKSRKAKRDLKAGIKPLQVSDQDKQVRIINSFLDVQRD